MNLPTIVYPSLREAFKRDEDTAAALSEYLGISYSSVLNKLSGKTEFTIPEAKLTAERYKTTIDKLFKNTS